MGGTFMAYAERKAFIEELERVRGSRIISYVLGDRETWPAGVPGFTLNLDTSPQLLFVDGLRKLGHVPALDLFLYTRGGSTDAVWPLVTTLRQYCDRLSVIVPFRAHSGGTLICLGADEVVMTPAGELSPIDPTTGNQFNPTDPANPGNRFGISVEDVSSYFELAKERAEVVGEAYRIDVLRELTRKVHPLALGNVQRIYMLIRRLAQSLLALHMDEKVEAERIKDIVTALSARFYSHVHAINQREAQALMGDWIKAAGADDESRIWALFDAYANKLELRSKFNLPLFMRDDPSKELKVYGGFIESTVFSYVHVLQMNVLQRPNLPANMQVQVPPGAQVPLVPWAGRLYDFSINGVGWQENGDAI
jgi:hypothetical protein